MAGRELKQLFQAFGAGDELAFRRAAQTIIEEEESKQHHALARDLKRLLTATGTDGRTHGSTVVLPELPRDPSSDWPLADVRHPSRYLSDLVLHGRTAEHIDQIVTESRQTELLREHGIEQRRRFLFWGPPGCGKTSAAEALAAELGVPLVVVRLESLISSYLGETASNLRKVMDYAGEGPWVLLFDEFDALGRLRDDPTEHGEIKRVVNAFLQMLDQYRGPGILIAATNHEQLLDPALWRRFDDVVEFPPPTVHQIRRLLRLRTASAKRTGVDIDGIASALKGLPHAAVEHAVVDARRTAILRGSDVLAGFDFDDAVDRVRNRPW